MIFPEKEIVVPLRKLVKKEALKLQTGYLAPKQRLFSVGVDQFEGSSYILRHVDRNDAFNSPETFFKCKFTF